MPAGPQARVVTSYEKAPILITLWILCSVIFVRYLDGFDKYLDIFLLEVPNTDQPLDIAPGRLLDVYMVKNKILLRRLQY